MTAGSPAERWTAVEVAEWAGNRVAVLLATYARCVDGQLPDLKRRLEAAGDLPEAETEVPGAG
ncbi:integrase [Streptomyces sp. CSDS2]|uniref:integrase n=1 Tax=Streptomyces sp. CSDS2 TaxID=3055051 RepID=UPI0025B11B14|nr:integrase [Streptomyces sp. CSDS2]MDN3264761.1 integrase [Streptomyces sp. CSDS2]